MKKIQNFKNHFSNAQQLTRQQMKMVLGGIESTTSTECAVYCGNEKKTRDCGKGVSCTTDGTKICCGSDCKEQCAAA